MRIRQKKNNPYSSIEEYGFFLVINKLKLTVCGTIVVYLAIVISDVIIHIVVDIYMVNKLKVNNSIPIVT